MDKDTIKEIAREFGIKNGIITLQEKISQRRLFDSFSVSRVYIPALFVINKIDMEPNYKKMVEGEFIAISADKKGGIDTLIDEVWKALKFVTVYLVKPNVEPNFNNPIVMKSNETLRDVATKIGSDFADSKKLVKIWGKEAKFPGQEVSFDTKVVEGMQIRFIS
jgi:hypothetical protein